MIVGALNKMDESSGNSPWDWRIHRGVALATRFKIVFSDELDLGRMQKCALKVRLQTKAGDRNSPPSPSSATPSTSTSATSATITTPEDGHDYEIVTVHLDHIEEHVRVHQVQKLACWVCSRRKCHCWGP